MGLRSKRTLSPNAAHTINKKSKTTFNVEENIEEHLDSILKDNCSWAEIEQHWGSTSNYRLKEIYEATSTQDVLSKWLDYKKPFGYKLVN